MAGRKLKRILCLDGGGFKGLSSMDSLKELMGQISRQYEITSELKPCEYFDLICGTGTGGLIAILLGRLQLDIDTAVERYIEIQKVITMEADLKRAISKLIPDELLPVDPKVDRASNFCRTLVLSVRPDGFQTAAVRMRSYGTEDYSAFNAKISSVVYAILAAPQILPPIDINGIFYAEASVWNNPTLEAMNEASYVWPTQCIDIFSIGTGIEDIEPPSQQASFLTRLLLRQPKTDKLFESAQLSEISEAIHADVISKWDTHTQKFSNYIRLNNCQGNFRVGLKEWGKDYRESSEMQKQIADRL